MSRTFSQIAIFLEASRVGMALSAVALLLTNSVLLGRSLPLPVLVAAFLGTWSVYAADALNPHSREDEWNQPLRRQLFGRYRGLLTILAALSLAVSTVLLTREATELSDGALVAVLGACGAMYALAIPTPSGSLRMKSHPSLKLIAITASWLSGALLVPLQLGHPSSSPAALSPWVLGAFEGVWLILDTVALNYRDRAGDLRAGLSTLAIRYAPHIPRLLRGTAVTTAIVAVAVGFASPGALLPLASMGGAMAFAAWKLPAWEAREIAVGWLVSGWRFAGAVAALFQSAL